MYVLLIACYVFYMSWKPVYGLLMFMLTLTNYIFGLLIAQSKAQRRLFLVVAIAVNLLTLAYFKYTYFAHDLAEAIGGQVGVRVPSIGWTIILPLGISFFVFEFIHYVSDVYKGSPPVRSFKEFALFASFFPTQIAGPIKRYQDFIPQVTNPVRPDLPAVEKGLYLIVGGLLRKVLFADYLAVVVHSAFEHPELLSGVDLWLAVYAFAFQIYFDFSAYTDIARGSALLLGFKVPENFNLPYLAGSISDFWRRWHISLSTWLRDYLFIPLGGSRSSTWLNYRNLAITMILGGIWHGAAAHFAIWGAYQGTLLILNKEFQRLAQRLSFLERIRETKLFHVFSVVLTFHMVCIGWVFFRAQTLAGAWLIIKKLLFLPQLSEATNLFSLSIINTTESTIFLILPVMLTLLFLGQLLALLHKRWPEYRLPRIVQGFGLALAVCLLIVLSPDYAPRFIYFQF
jgi:D-alanyl-lipoteichoic acid acyltransferase DltB (MBOAT superfamily)